ncbi:tyrosine-type recombinase/integrase [Flavobacterium terrae]|uniref:Site-specific recombinase XerD n=1 Tax=Flavobacterium terrae TaxID=415425 RepID=A0A1M6DDQ9_9FLAO|nr:site-specific integrase [Flavobacterium terrae]SHI71342.1 Site-specific recombinase XerD [Flavobacterium terrae]
MSKIFLYLQKVHDLVYSLEHNTQINQFKNLLKQKEFTSPKIFTGGVNILLWNQLSESEKSKALSKSWYVYYSFRDVKTGKLKRMPNIKGNANKLKTKKERIDYLSAMSSALEFLLEKGFNPNIDNNNIEELLNKKQSDSSKANNNSVVIPKEKIAIINDSIAIPETLTIKEAFEFALNIKKNTIRDTSYKNFELRVRKFRKSLDENKPITFITKKVINDYLNGVLINSSARNRNNTRADLSSLFQVLEDNEVIVDNVIKKINVLKSNPERNKTYTSEMQKDIYFFLEENDKLLLLFIKFVSYNFLRPIEVCELKIKDIDLIGKRIYLRTKNKAVKIKIIPEILMNDLPDLSKFNPESFLFTPNGFGQDWITEPNNKRDYFSKRFKEVVKTHFNLNKDYGMYSFRHTFITKLYREMRKTSSQFETKSKLMLVTGHSTMTALEKYLRDIDAELPEDYSHLLK